MQRLFNVGKVGVTKTGAMFPPAIVVFRPQPGIVRGDPRRVVWTYRPVD